MGRLNHEAECGASSHLSARRAGCRHFAVRQAPPLRCRESHYKLISFLGDSEHRRERPGPLSLAPFLGRLVFTASLLALVSGARRPSGRTDARPRPPSLCLASLPPAADTGRLIDILVVLQAPDQVSITILAKFRCSCSIHPTFPRIVWYSLLRTNSALHTMLQGSFFSSFT